MNQVSRYIQFIVDVLKSRLDKFLVDHGEGRSRSLIQKDIEAGLVVVNGKKIIEPKHVVRLEDVVIYEPPSKSEEAIVINAPLKVLYNNHGLLIIDKPAGLVVHPGSGFKGESLVSALLYYFEKIHLVGEEHRPGIVHRLDKDTSGVILVALTQDMYEYLKDAFADRKVKKEYIALVEGNVEATHGFIDSPVGKSKTDFRKYTTKNMILAKEALTEYQVLEHLTRGVDSVKSFENEIAQPLFNRVDEYSLVRVRLHTGRTHQIRVHFSSIGHPIVGDTLYGKQKTHVKDAMRQFLHAAQIEVRLPDGTWIEAESKLPQDLRDILKKLKSTKVDTL